MQRNNSDMVKITPGGAAAMIGNTIYFSARDYNALLKTNIRTGRTEYICRFNSESVSAKLHCKAFAYGAVVWFIPLYGKFITSFDTQSGEMISYENRNEFIAGTFAEDYSYTERDGSKVFPMYFDAGLIDSENFFAVPAGRENLAIVNMKERRITLLSLNNKGKREFLGAGTCIDNEIWMAPYSGKEIVIVNFVNGEISRIESPIRDKKYYGITSDSDKVYLANNTGYFFCLNKSDSNFIKIETSVQNCVERNALVRELTIIDDKLYFLPNDSELLFAYDIHTELIIMDICNNGVKYGTFQEVFSVGTKPIFMSYTEGYFYSPEDSVGIVYIEIPIFAYERLLEANWGQDYPKRLKRDDIILENELPLSLYIKCILQNKL